MFFAGVGEVQFTRDLTDCGDVLHIRLVADYVQNTADAFFNAVLILADSCLEILRIHLDMERSRNYQNRRDRGRDALAGVNEFFSCDILCRAYRARW